MGVFSSKIWNDMLEVNKQVTPATTRKHRRTLPNDPRSVTSEIDRTPIQIDISTLEDSNSFITEEEFLRDPRSPTRKFQRTPIPIEKLNLERKDESSLETENLQMEKEGEEHQTTDQATLEIRKTNNRVASVKKPEEMPAKIQDESISIEKTPQKPQPERSPLKVTTRTNSLLKTVHQNQLLKLKNDSVKKQPLYRSSSENSPKFHLEGKKSPKRQLAISTYDKENHITS